MPSPGSHPAPLQVTDWQRTRAKRLVLDHGLRRNGLGRAQLDEILLHEEKRADFLTHYAIRTELGPAVFWQLIAEIDQERISGEEAQLASSTTANQPATTVAGTTSHERPTSRTPSLARLESQPRPRGPKRTRRTAAQETDEADDLSPNTSVEHSPKRKRRTKSTAANVSTPRRYRQCPGTFGPNGEHFPCEEKFKYPGSWGKHWDACHRTKYKLDTKVCGMKYRCVEGCPHRFEHSVALKKHQFQAHAIIVGETVSARSQAANNLDSSSVERSHTAVSNDHQSLFHPDNGNQPQPGPLPVNSDTSDDNVEAGPNGDNGTNGATFVNGNNSQAHLPRASFAPPTAALAAPVATSQVPDPHTPSLFDVASNHDVNLDFWSGNLDPGICINTEAALDFNSLELNLFTNGSVGPEAMHRAGSSTEV